VIEAALRAAGDHLVRNGLVTVQYEPRDLKLEIRGDREIPHLDRTIAPLAEAPPRVLMLTNFDLDEYVLDALVAGASVSSPQ
jgi:hypothetical protein